MKVLRIFSGIFGGAIGSVTVILAMSAVGAKPDSLDAHIMLWGGILTGLIVACFRANP